MFDLRVFGLALAFAGLTATAPGTAGLTAQIGTSAPDSTRREDPGASGTLPGFERLIGTWASGTTRQTFEWGVGHLAVRARATVVDERGERLVSEGMFLHDPLRDTVRGYFVAVEMPVAYFEYSARWEGDALVAHLTTTEPDGSARRYVESWRLLDRDRIAWSLREGVDEGGEPMMSAEFDRVPPAAGASERGGQPQPADSIDSGTVNRPTPDGGRP